MRRHFGDLLFECVSIVCNIFSEFYVCTCEYHRWIDVLADDFVGYI